MPRRLVLVVLLLAAGSAPAQDLPPPSPADLARGLREGGLPDLALEYLDDLSKTASPDLKKVLPLERAKCRLELAVGETEDAVRAGMVADAKREFDAFVKGNPGHPRLPEAAVALAQLQTIEGKAQLQRSRRVPADQQAAEAAKARPLFQAAAKQYEGAAEGLRKLTDKEDPGTARHKELTRDYLQAVLDRGVNLYLLADSYGEDARDKNLEDRQQAAKEAGLIFEGLWRRDGTHPLAWVGRAWAAESQHLLDEHLKAEIGFKDLLTEAQKLKTPASAAGVRMARFFQLRQEFVAGGHDAAASADRLKVRASAKSWLADYPAARPTAEVYAARYYLGTACVNEGLKRENLTIETTKPADPKDKPTEKVVGVKDSGLLLLREADAQFRILVRTDNEYADRATRQRAKALRWLVGNPDRPPAQFAAFDECYMAALVQLERVREVTAAPERDEGVRKAIALLERAGDLPVPPESIRDAARAQLDLARTYIAGRRPHAAAVLAEHLLRTTRSPAVAARAAVVALAGYQTAADQTAPQNQEARGVDRDRMTALAVFAEKVAPDDPATDEVRLQLGVLYSQANRPVDMFEVLSRIPPRFPRLAQARLYQGLAAFELLRPPGRDEAPRADDLPADKKQALFRRAVADLGAVPEPAKEVSADQVRFYVNLRLQLGQLYITQGTKEYPTAERITVAAAATAAGHAALSSDDKLKFALRCERQRLRAVYGQAMPLYIQGKYPEAAERFDPLVKEVLKAGPAVKANQPADVAELAKALDADRINLLLVPALNARVREGAVAKTGELLDELKKFGGDLSTTARVVQQGVAGIAPTVKVLRKDGKTDEADKLVAAVSGMVTKLAAEPNLPTDVRLNLGRSFRDLGEYAKAIELMEAIPAPASREALKAELPAKPDETEEDAKRREADNAAAGPYRQARLELARSYRLDGKFDKAAAVLDDALGKEKEPRADKVRPREGGWATRYSDFRREGIFLIEARAAAAPVAKESIPLWNEALANWRGWGSDYLRALNALNQPYSLKKRDAERLTARVRVCDDLAARDDEVDFAAEKKKVQAELEAVERDLEAAGNTLSEAIKAVGTAKPEDVEKAREAADERREAADALGKRAAELRARLPVLDEMAKKKPAEWADEGRKAQKDLEALQKEMGDAERKMNPLKATWADVLADLFRCQMLSAASAYKEKPDELTKVAGKYATGIADFEKANRPLPAGVRQKLFDLIDSQPVLKEKYKEVGGTDSLTPPAER